MKKHPKTFYVTRVSGKRSRVTITKLLSLGGVEGFALHRALPGVEAKWVVSHIDTGAAAGSGPTQSIALICAQQAALTRDVIKDIKKVKLKIAKLRLK